jgi:uncharacterized protein (DUF4213/DUF364 family)
VVPTIAERYVALAKRIALRFRSPRVRALHLAPRHAPGDKDAEFCALELDDGSIGFSYVLLGDTERMLRTQVGASAIAGTDAGELARGYAATDPVAKTLGFAAINALSQQLFSRAGWTPPSDTDSLARIALERGDHIGMVGLFRPLVARIGEAGAKLTVLELVPELAGEHGHFRVTLDPGELASCDKVVSTCTVLLNDTFDEVLAACRNARHFAIIGPTAGCAPDPLFERGVDSIGGRRVVDRKGFVDALTSGGKWGAFAEKYVISRDAYSGIDWLLDRAG